MGFKELKWLKAIEFVQDFINLRSTQGGCNKDHEFFSYRMPILRLPTRKNS